MVLHWPPDAPPVPDRPTPESIAAAKAQRDRERATFTERTGFMLDDDGRILGLRLRNAIWLAINGPPKRES